ncbi:hypothetical protein [Chengkuizengella axinellae]|uniref:Uncharacterized protein n=1 Tax=Chengkuizengella axinellae TaxID=3064388 RepID=A0ABT9IXQ2_9BACL|nr:hypothetical protein [Chengkuizengella sp. 2205SS18-9]MDP5273584.1 hypothetical protein [Chengkuizengella sp. 2205SS18-9]
MRGDSNSVSLKMIITSGIEIWELSFKGVSKLQTTYVERFTADYDDWISEEILNIDEKTLSFRNCFPQKQVF